MMMDDDDQLEAALRRYAVRSPRSSLREAVLSRRPPQLVSLTIVDWGMAAALAGLLVAMTIVDRPSLRPGGEMDAVRAAQVQEISALLGGGPLAVRLAELAPAPPDAMDSASEVEE